MDFKQLSGPLGLAAAACAACCAPLVLPPLAALLGGAGLGLAAAGQLMLAAALALAGFVLVYLGRRRRVRRQTRLHQDTDTPQATRPTGAARKDAPR